MKMPDRISDVPSSPRYLAALSLLKVTALQKRMLLAHAKHDGPVQASSLAAELGTHHGVVNLWHGGLAHAIADQMDLRKQLPTYSKGPLWMAAIAEVREVESGNSLYSWNMYEQVRIAVDRWVAQL